MKTKLGVQLALAAYWLAIAFLTACAVVIVMKLIFWPPCTQSGNICAIDGWTAAGLAGTVLGVAATVLAILGAVAVAAWWTSLNDRVVNQVIDLYNKQKEDIRILILKSIVTPSELQHLQNLANPEPFLAVDSGSFIPELRQLQMWAYIEGNPGQGIGPLEDALRQYGRVNAKDYLHITEAGKWFLKQVE